jgi:hypothetical protein
MLIFNVGMKIAIGDGYFLY